ncbi:hypothetical protein ACEZ3G_04465 [Maribacter algicola]|uniref:Uncharacterized protein n=1 Tax=Meishania litoralis TaxID=3434685 RepID=A0ACC7LGD9_9FLAO
MEIKKQKYRYIEWLSAEEMHGASKKWMSELSFIKDEQLFLNDLVKSYTLQLIDSEVFNKSQKIIDRISKAESEVITLMKRVQSHENLLEIMVNDVDELKMEKAYLETHWELTDKIERYMVDYRNLKVALFKVISRLMKKDKQKRLLN